MNRRLLGGVLSVGLGCFSLGFISGYNVPKVSTFDAEPKTVYLSSVKMVPGICVQPTWFVERWEQPNPILRLMEEGEKQWRTERWFDDHWDTTILSVYKRSVGEYRVVTCPIKRAQWQTQNQNVLSQDPNRPGKIPDPRLGQHSGFGAGTDVVLPTLPLSGIIIKKEMR